MHGIPRELGALRDTVGLVAQRIGALELRLDRLDDRMSRYFLWLVGLLVTTLATAVGSLLAQL